MDCRDFLYRPNHNRWPACHQDADPASLRHRDLRNRLYRECKPEIHYSWCCIQALRGCCWKHCMGERMKPELIIQDFAGAHNSDLNKTTARLIKGASWKKQRIVVIIPSADLIPAKVALSHWNLAFPPNNGVVRILAQGLEVGDAYSSAIEQVLAHPELSQWEYLLTIEADNCPSGDGVVKLVERMDAHPELACIGGLYFTKGEGGVAQIWGDIQDPVVNFRPQPPDPNGG